MLAFFLLLRAIFEIRDPVVRFMVLVPMIMLPLLSMLYLNHAVDKFYTFDELVLEELDTHTREGNPYRHQEDKREVENGHYTWIYVCDEELEREWNLRSRIGYHENASNGRSVKVTLIRFLTSKT